MFKIFSSQNVLKMFEDACNLEFQDCGMEMIHPKFKEEVMKGLKWAIFYKANPFDTTPYPYDDFVYDYFSYSLIEKAKEALEASGEKSFDFFEKDVDEYLKNNHNFVTSFSFESKDCDVNLYKDNLQEKEVEMVVKLTFPSSEKVFSSLIVGEIFSNGNEWLYEYMDIYDQWRLNLLDNVSRKTYQFGGTGRFIQREYDKYIAQANHEIGDSGSLYVFLNNEGKIDCSIDMF